MNFIITSKPVYFRVWDTKEKTMHYVAPYSSFHGVESNNGKKNRHDKHSFMTWDGFSYENGKLQNYVFLHCVFLIHPNEHHAFKNCWVFESDIVKFTDINSEEIIGVVSWNPILCRFHINDKNGMEYPICSSNNYQVLGNIYEHTDRL